VCTVTTTAPTGNVYFQVDAYASIDGSGSPLSAAFFPQTIVSGSQNVSVTLNGIPASVAFVPSSAACSNGVACTAATAIAVYDAAGSVIVGPGSFISPSGGSESFSWSCQGASALGLGTSTSTNQIGNFGAPAANTVSEAAYDGTIQAGGSATGLNCTVTDGGSLSSTFTMSLETGSVTWGVQ
jgi:hypothetical protein